jgi:hypothetical protein
MRCASDTSTTCESLFRANATEQKLQRQCSATKKPATGRTRGRALRTWREPPTRDEHAAHKIAINFHECHRYWRPPRRQGTNVTPRHQWHPISSQLRSPGNKQSAFAIQQLEAKEVRDRSSGAFKIVVRWFFGSCALAAGQPLRT